MGSVVVVFDGPLRVRRGRIIFSVALLDTVTLAHMTVPINAPITDRERWREAWHSARVRRGRGRGPLVESSADDVLASRFTSHQLGGRRRLIEVRSIGDRISSRHEGMISFLASCVRGLPPRARAAYVDSWKDRYGSAR